MPEPNSTRPVNNRNELLGFPKSYAFVIGINYYPEINADLISAVPDAREMARILKYRQGFDHVELLLGVDPEVPQEKLRIGLDDLTVLTSADKTDIIDLLQRLQDPEQEPKIQEEDCVVFYFAGHGKAGEFSDGPAGYLLPSDAQPKSAMLENDSLIPMEEVFNALKTLNCHHTLLILDCCFAGKFRYIGQKTRDVEELFFMPMYEERFERFKRGRAWQVLVSAGPHQTAADWMGDRTDTGTGVHSPFARALIEALEGQAEVKPSGENFGDGVLTSQELFLYLWNKVEEWTHEGVSIQHPDLFPMARHEGGQFIFFHPENPRNLPDYHPRNPYMGLKAFEEKDSDLFFGRTAVIEALVTKLEEKPLLLITGPSGSGKSSVIQAGLFPAFQDSASDEVEVEILTMRPGEHPLAPFGHISAKLDTGKMQIVCIDQYEELFLECTDPLERKEFEAQLIDLHKRAADTGNLKIVLGLRSDFEWQLEASDFGKEFWNRENLYTFMYRLPPMGLDELRQALVAPAWVEAYDFASDRLVDFILEEVSYAPGALPLLSFTMSELYRLTGPEDKQIFTFDNYKSKLGGVNGALTRRAEQVYDDLPDDAHRRTMEQILMRMVRLNDGSYARRPVSVGGSRSDDLNELGFPYDPEGEMVELVLQRLAAAHLIVSGAAGESVVEPVHDSLINFWPRCLQWIDNFTKENLLLQRQLWQAVLERVILEELEVNNARANDVRQETIENIASEREFDQQLSPLWDTNPKLFQVIESLMQLQNRSMLGIDETLLERRLDEIESSLNGTDREQFQTFRNQWLIKGASPNLDAFVISGVSFQVLEAVVQLGEHWLNRHEQDFILASWEKRIGEIVRLKEQRDEAVAARQEADKALQELQQATVQIVKDVLNDAEVDIYHLRYEEAMQKYGNTKEVGLGPKVKNQWIRGAMEVAFVFNEIGWEEERRLTLAAITCDFLAEVAGVPGLNRRNSPEIDQFLQRLYPQWYEALNRRYFPVMIDVAGGIVRTGRFLGRRVPVFKLAQTLTTIWQYYLYCESSKEDTIIRIGNGLSWGLDGDNPVAFVYGIRARWYANWLNRRKGVKYRLPKEIEWEYAARGAERQQNYVYCGSNNPKEVGWYGGNSRMRTQSVAKLKPIRKRDPAKRDPGLAIYDMSGNVWDTCIVDPMLPHQFTLWHSLPGDIHRGGAWPDVVKNLDVSCRRVGRPDYRFGDSGFRLAGDGLTHHGDEVV